MQCEYLLKLCYLNLQKLCIITPNQFILGISVILQIAIIHLWLILHNVNKVNIVIFYIVILLYFYIYQLWLIHKYLCLCYDCLWLIIIIQYHIIISCIYAMHNNCHIIYYLYLLTIDASIANVKYYLLFIDCSIVLILYQWYLILFITLF